MSYGMIKKYVTTDDEGNAKTVLLAFNPLTLVKYKNFTGHDFMADFMMLGAAGSKEVEKLSPEARSMLDKGKLDFALLKESDIDILQKMNSARNTEFYINLYAAMIATAEHMNGKPAVDFAEILSDMPFDMLYDADFTKDIIEMIAFGLKKNNALAQIATQLM